MTGLLRPKPTAVIATRTMASSRLSRLGWADCTAFRTLGVMRNNPLVRSYTAELVSVILERLTGSNAANLLSEPVRAPAEVLLVILLE
jgi:hypothetical protein